MEISNDPQKQGQGEQPGTNQDTGVDRNARLEIGKEDVDWSNPTQVINFGKKYLIPVSNVSAEEAVDTIQPDTLPDGSPNPKAGEQFTDWRGDSIGEKCILVPNHTDNSWQAAPVDALIAAPGAELPEGSPVFIINEIDEATAKQIDSLVASYGKPIGEFTASEVADVLSRVRTELGIGDMYDSTREYTGGMKKLANQSDDCFGHVQQNKPMEAVFIPGNIEFDGAASSAQQSKDGNGLVIVRNPGADPSKARAVQPEVFERTYLQNDESPIKSSDLNVS